MSFLTTATAHRSITMAGCHHVWREEIVIITIIILQQPARWWRWWWWRWQGETTITATMATRRMNARNNKPMTTEGEYGRTESLLLSSTSLSCTNQQHDDDGDVNNKDDGWKMKQQQRYTQQQQQQPRWQRRLPVQTQTIHGKRCMSTVVVNVPLVS